MLEEFDPMCDEAAFRKKQTVIQAALAYAKREQDIAERVERGYRERNEAYERFRQRTAAAERVGTWQYVPNPYTTTVPTYTPYNTATGTITYTVNGVDNPLGVITDVTINWDANTTEVAQHQGGLDYRNYWV